VLLIIRRFDRIGLAANSQWAGLELAQVIDRVQYIAVGVALLRRKLKQDGLDIRIDQVRRDLRPHHTSAQHRGFSNDER